MPLKKYKRDNGRFDVKAILMDKEARGAMLAGAIKFLIAIGRYT